MDADEIRLWIERIAAAHMPVVESVATALDELEAPVADYTNITTALELIRLADEQGGGTVSTKTGREVVWDTGYAVASHGIVVGKVEDSNGHLDAIVAFLEDVDAEYVGSWLDEGLYYIDVSYHVEDREKAVGLGRLWNQKAIYDLGNGTDITL